MVVALEHFLDFGGVELATRVVALADVDGVLRFAVAGLWTLPQFAERGVQFAFVGLVIGELVDLALELFDLGEVVAPPDCFSFELLVSEFEVLDCLL